MTIVRFADIFISWLYWWSGDTIGVLLVAPAVIALLGTPKNIWRPRRLSVGLPLLLSCGLIGMGFTVVSRLEHNNRQAEFERDAVLLFSIVRDAFHQVEEVPLSLGDLFRGSQHVERREFDQFAASIYKRHKSLQALEWVLRVPHGQLASYERAIRAEGYPRYSVFEKSTEGERVPVGQREEYFPVSYVYPMEGNQAAFGFDLASEPMRRAAIEKARKGGRLVVSDRIRLVQERGGQFGILVLAPYFDANQNELLGFTLSVVRIGQLVETALLNVTSEGLGYRLVDLDSASDRQVLFETGKVGHVPAHVYDGTFQFGDRLWKLTLFAGSDYRLAHRVWYIWALLAGTVAISAMLSFFLLVMSGRSARIEQMVKERTDELDVARTKAEKYSQLLKEAVSSITQGFTIYDQNDRLVICNDAYKQIYSTSADLIVPGNTFEEIVRAGAERGQYAAALGRVDEWVKSRVAQHQSAKGEVIEQRLDDGRWLMIIEYRTPSGFIVGNRIDITKLKQATVALEEKNTQLDALFRLSPDGLVLYDQAGYGKFANPAFLRMTGLMAAEVFGHTLMELEGQLRALAENPDQWDGLEGCFLEMQKVDDGNTVSDERRHLLMLKRPWSAVLEFVGVQSGKSGEGGSVGRLLYVRDVTHEIEVDRMKSEFLSHAAHELRTPMTSIYGFSELLMSQEFDEATRKDLLTTIHRQTAWLVDIINELLDLARIESRRGKDFKLEAVDVGQLVADVLAVMQIDPVRWPLSCTVPAGLPAVWADAAKLRQALANVLGNAVKYSPDGGAIAVWIDARGDGRGGAQVGVTVADQGIGMTSDQVARVFERFYRADTSGNIPGTGLGMSIVKEIIELLGGRVEINSTAGTGTTISLWVPAFDPGKRATAIQIQGERP